MPGQERCNGADEDCDGAIDEHLALCPFPAEIVNTLPLESLVYVAAPILFSRPSGMIFHSLLDDRPELRVDDGAVAVAGRAFLRPSDLGVLFVGADPMDLRAAMLYENTAPAPTPVLSPCLPSSTGAMLRDLAFGAEGSMYFSCGDLYHGTTRIAPAVERAYLSPAGRLVVFHAVTASAIDASGRESFAVDLSGFDDVGVPCSVTFSGEHAFVTFAGGFLVRMDLETGEVVPVRTFVHDHIDPVVGLPDGRVIYADYSSTSAVSTFRLLELDATRRTLWAPTSTVGVFRTFEVPR